MRKSLTLAAKLSSMSKSQGHCQSFLRNIEKEPASQMLVEELKQLDLRNLGILNVLDPYYFKKEGITKVEIERTEDYRVVMFCLPKGTKMYLHDHPNMAIYFQQIFGTMKIRCLDKINEKFQYNEISNDELLELTSSSKIISAKVSFNQVMKARASQVILPNRYNCHEMIALENSCFIDYQIPGYSAISASRKISYFEEIKLQNLPNLSKADFADNTLDCSNSVPENFTLLKYEGNSTQPPNDFIINEALFRGVYQ
ncbi:uncharacterized protein STYLEM_1141 [Stylonychia lemnae]|uniref:Cysteine dioxygenase n=1 Tax=Stylonychia lemnae TaxID=5949 RepID=A0A077ZUQ9_STYLE|nr:uncharacterized protein STYLEM_1141 [Stylonychia lemnae]|eukprot:CDW72186.1 uncharacterized protein STYLEM_1141 [Stylonychia lemnae]